MKILSLFTEIEWLSRVSFLVLLVFCTINGCEVGRSDLPRTVVQTKYCMFIGAGERNMRYLSDNDLLSSVIDAEGQMARFVAKTLKVCSGIICCFPHYVYQSSSGESLRVSGF